MRFLKCGKKVSMNNRKKLPVAVENFEKLIKENFYYVDKTTIIATLLKSWAKVNIFTRPRRFGKSVNMNMLKTFFEIGSDKSVFEGLKISEEKELCDKFGKVSSDFYNFKRNRRTELSDSQRSNAACDWE